MTNGASDLVSLKHPAASLLSGTQTDFDSQGASQLPPPPAVTQLSATAKSTVVPRVQALQKQLDDRVCLRCAPLKLSPVPDASPLFQNSQVSRLASQRNCHLLSRELQVCYNDRAFTDAAMQAVAGLVQSVMKILPPCFLHSPQNSSKPDWLFEEKEREHGEALEQLLSAAAAGVLVCAHAQLALT